MSYADRVVAMCASIAGQAVTGQYPKLDAAVVIANWDHVREEILDPLVEAVADV